MNNERQNLSLSADRAGTIASSLCFVHCLLTPVLLSFSSVWAHYLPSEERLHRLLAVIVAAIGCFAIISGYRKHRRPRVLVFMSAGLSFIFFGAYFGDHIPSHVCEVAVTMIGSVLLITAHRFNHTFCKNCQECDPSKADPGRR